MRHHLWTSAVAIGLATLGGCKPEPPEPVAPATPTAAPATKPKVDAAAAPEMSEKPAAAETDSAGGEWGGITGRVILSGELPGLADLIVPGKLAVKGAAVCAVKAIPDETLVVDPKPKGIANVVVCLRRKPETIHPSLEKSAAPTVLYDQIGCRFVPHVIVARTDQR